jgi:hypothetical protein
VRLQQFVVCLQKKKKKKDKSRQGSKGELADIPQAGDETGGESEGEGGKVIKEILIKKINSC